MVDFIKKVKRQEVTTVTLLYSIFFIIGIFSYRDFGVSVDEWDLRIMGYVNLKYILEVFSQDSAVNFTTMVTEFEKDTVLSIPKIHDYTSSTHGVVFALPTAFVEYFFNITDSKKYYLLRHYLNHLIFLISNFYFFLLVRQRFNSWFFGILGALFLFLSPRIFAESFYNHKDLLFMSLFIISLYYGIIFLKFPTFTNSLLFALTSAIAIDLRIMGIILTPIIIFFLFLKNLRNKKFIIFPGIFIYLTFLFLFIFLFWPYLWENPINNFIEIFKNLGNYDWSGYVLYLGNFYKGSELPWHYILVWIVITTPIFYLLIFLLGFFSYTNRFINRLIKILTSDNEINFWKSESELQDLIYYLIFIIPIFIVIFLNSTLYGGWSHLYFIYPLFLLIAINGIYFIYLNFFKKKFLQLKIMIFLFLIHIVFLMLKDHPHQNVYFNFFAGNKIETSFDLDHWGLSNKQAFEFILNNDKNTEIRIGSAGPISLHNSRKILDLASRERILISQNDEADYIIDNYANWHGKHKRERYKIPKNFNVYKEIFVSGKRIVSIYKRL